LTTLLSRAVEQRAAAPSSGVRLDIEGLRAVAVTMVLVHHTGVGVLSGGFAGVDVFFVISGFLITSLLLRELDRSATVSVSAFYARRVRRLLPAASLVILVTLALGWWVLPSSARPELGTDGIAAALYVLNWVLAARSVDYLAQGAAVSPLQHYWSLSVEEQYYVVWPLAILLAVAVSRRLGWRPRRVLLAVVAVGGLASLAWSLWLTHASPATAYFVSTTRVWELAIGSLLAFAAGALRGLTRRGSVLLAWSGLAAIAWTAVFFSERTSWPGAAALVPTLGTAAVIAAGCSRHGGGADRVLGLPPLTWVGGRSYGIYLWHWPLIVLALARWPGLPTWTVVGVGLLAVPLAVLTKRWVEDPLRFGRWTRGSSRALALGAATMAACVLSGYLLVGAAPVVARSAGVSGVTGAGALVADADAARWRLAPDPQRLFTSTGRVVPEPGAAPLDVPLQNACLTRLGSDEIQSGCVFGQRDSDVTVALLGDSKAHQWIPALRRIANREGWRLEVYLKAACTVTTAGVVPDCAAYNEAVLARLREHVPDYAIVSHRGTNYDASTGGLDDGLAAIQSLGTEVVLLADNASPLTQTLYDCVERHPDDYGQCSFPRDAALARSGTPLLEEAADRLDAPYVDLNRWICPPGSACPPVIAHTLVYRRGSHLTATYVESLTPMLHRALRSIGMAGTPVREIGLGP
jgi:peptidoglycan/LPS O-acetylase OafA/YrhL